AYPVKAEAPLRLQISLPARKQIIDRIHGWLGRLEQSLQLQLVDVVRKPHSSYHGLGPASDALDIGVSQRGIAALSYKVPAELSEGASRLKVTARVQSRLQRMLPGMPGT